MKTRSIILLVIAILFAACESKRELKGYVYVNKDIEACGVLNPMENIEWLKEKHDYFFNLVNSNKPQVFQIDERGPIEYYTTFNSFCLIRNDSTMEDFIIFDDRTFSEMYDCSGKLIVYGGYVDLIHLFSDIARPDESPRQSSMQKSPVWIPPFDTTYLKNCSFIDTIAIYNRREIHF